MTAKGLIEYSIYNTGHFFISVGQIRIMNKEAVEKEIYREGSSRDGGIEQAFQNQVSLNPFAVTAGLTRFTYFLPRSFAVKTF